jgi:hypothetical protein
MRSFPPKLKLFRISRGRLQIKVGLVGIIAAEETSGVVPILLTRERFISVVLHEQDIYHSAQLHEAASDANDGTRQT